MPVLLLAYGDPQAKKLLVKAIERRYGFSPPAIEKLRIYFKGRTHTRIGPVKTWVSTDVATHFIFPRSMRSDTTLKPFRLPVQKSTEAFDGEIYRTNKGGKVTVDEQKNRIRLLQGRMWTMAALLLTPLSESYIKLTLVDERTFTALDTKMDTSITIQLRDDATVQCITTQFLDNETDRQYTYEMLLSQEIIDISGLPIPKTLCTSLDGEPLMELKPERVKFEAEIPTAIFTLAGNAQI